MNLRVATIQSKLRKTIPVQIDQDLNKSGERICLHQGVHHAVLKDGTFLIYILMKLKSQLNWHTPIYFNSVLICGYIAMIS